MHSHASLIKPTFAMNPMLWLAASFAMGIILGRFWLVRIEILIAIIVGLSLLAIVLRGHTASTFFILTAFVFAGWFSLQAENASVSPDRIKHLFEEGTLISGDPVEIDGVMTGELEPSPDGYFLTLGAKSVRLRGGTVPASGKVRLFLPIATDEARADLAALELGYGSRAFAATRLEREDRYQNPGVMKRTGMLDLQGIDATGTLKSPLLIEHASQEPVFIPLAIAYDMRLRAIERFRASFSPPTSSVLIASVLGNKYFLDKSTADIFREGGTYHILVISGLHITFIGGLILLLARIFTSNRKIQAAATISLLWLYALAVGGEAPVMRACLLFTVVMIGYASYRTASLLNSLGLCAVLLLVWQPSDLFDPSFQLTFVSVSAIVAFSLPLLTRLRAIGRWMPSSETPFPPNVPDVLRRFCETVYWNDVAWDIESKRQVWSAKIFKNSLLKRVAVTATPRWVSVVFDGIVVTTAVQLFMLPLLVYYFHRVSIVSVPLNLWVGSVLAVESIVAVTGVILGLLSTNLALPFIVVAEMLNWLLITGSSLLTNPLWASIRLPVYSGLMRSVYLIYFIPVIAGTLLLYKWDAFALNTISRRARAILFAVLGTAAVLAGIILFHPFSAPRADGRLHVEFLDVGQGDSALVTCPNGKTMLVDAGGRMNYSQQEGETFEPDVPRIGEAVVSEFLWERGLSRVDAIVATHADTDHIQGLVDVVNNFSVGTAYFGRLDGDDADMIALQHELDRRGIPKVFVSAGESFEIDGVRLEVLNPPPDASSLSGNNSSIVIRIVYGETAFLLTGDIEQEAEKLTIASEPNITSTVVKVPHHGSRSSSTQAFVDAANAQYAVISVGKRSVFGHPHPEVVERWKSSGASVMTTGDNGTITLSTDGRELWLSTFLPDISVR